MAIYLCWFWNPASFICLLPSRAPYGFMIVYGGYNCSRMCFSLFLLESVPRSTLYFRQHTLLICYPVFLQGKISNNWRALLRIGQKLAPSLALNFWYLSFSFAMFDNGQEVRIDNYVTICCLLQPAGSLNVLSDFLLSCPAWKRLR